MRRLAAGLVPLLAIAAGVALFAQWPIPTAKTDAAVLRVVLSHTGALKAASAASLSSGELARLPQGVSAVQILGGERYPVRLRLDVDGRLAMEREYRPGGLHKEGNVNAVASLPLTPGEHTLHIQLMDDGVRWRTVFDGSLSAGAGEVRLLAYDPTRDAFTPR